MFYWTAKYRNAFCWCVITVFGLACASAVHAADKDTEPPKPAVMIPFHSMIDPLSGEIFKTKFNEALESGVQTIIIDIYSPGGFTYVTYELMDLIGQAKDVETVAFIDREAISGAALISLTCDRIVMLPGALIGDAGEIVMGPNGEFRYTEAKSRSYLVGKIREAAERTGRPATLAEKMCDKDMVVFSATKDDGTLRYFSETQWETMEDVDQWERGKPVLEATKDKFFTASGDRAVELGIAEDVIRNRSELASLLNVREPIPAKPWTWADSTVVILNSSFVAFLLIAIGLIALLIELSAPGISVGGLLSATCFGLFFWSRFLGGTAGWLEVVLFALGLMFIAAEVFVIPGFGVAGLGGLGLIIAALVMASRRFVMPDGNMDYTGISGDVLVVISAICVFMIALVALSNYIGQIPGLSRLTLSPSIPAADPNASRDRERLPLWQQVQVGDAGVAMSPLRPSGKMEYEGGAVDVVTEGDFVDPGTPVKIVAKQGARIVVRVDSTTA